MDTAERVTPELTALIKNAINVTWDDEETDNKIASIIEDGFAYLDRIAGEQLDFNENTEAKRLLKHYCRYAYAGAESDFKIDYASDLTALNIDRRIEQRKQQNE